jgi:hypothetical protein
MITASDFCSDHVCCVAQLIAALGLDEAKGHNREPLASGEGNRSAFGKRDGVADESSTKGVDYLN